MSERFSNKVVLVTGAASGFGAAIAERFSNLGAQLSLIDINWKGLEEISEKCATNNGQKPLLIKADLTKEEDVKQIIEKTITEFGKLDVLINNAGISELGSIETTTLQQFDRVFNINSRAIFHLTQLAIPYLIASKGNIVNISSLLSVCLCPDNIAYTLSKNFVANFTKNIALDLAPKGIRVNSIAPGFVMTNIYKSTGLSDQIIEMLFQSLLLSTPLGREGQVEDVAKAVTFLASDDAEHITGVNLSVDGGMHLNGTVPLLQK